MLAYDYFMLHERENRWGVFYAYLLCSHPESLMRSLFSIRRILFRISSVEGRRIYVYVDLNLFRGDMENFLLIIYNLYVVRYD